MRTPFNLHRMFCSRGRKDATGKIPLRSQGRSQFKNPMPPFLGPPRRVRGESHPSLENPDGSAVPLAPFPSFSDFPAMLLLTPNGVGGGVRNKWRRWRARQPSLRRVAEDRLRGLYLHDPATRAYRSIPGLLRRLPRGIHIWESDGVNSSVVFSGGHSGHVDSGPLTRGHAAICDANRISSVGGGVRAGEGGPGDAFSPHSLSSGSGSDPSSTAFNCPMTLGCRIPHRAAFSPQSHCRSAFAGGEVAAEEQCILDDIFYVKCDDRRIKRSIFFASFFASLFVPQPLPRRAPTCSHRCPLGES